MDADKLAVLCSKFGFPVLVAAYALWRLDWFMTRIVDSQDRIAILLERLIQLH